MITGTNYYLRASNTLMEVINNINESEFQICFIVDEKNILLGSITDGDIRRGLLDGHTTSSLAGDIMRKDPISIQFGASNEDARLIMKKYQIKQLPVLSESRQLLGLHLWDSIFKLKKKENSILIMAGGFGKRMMPLTENVPKPMLKVGGKPVLEHIILKAKEQGFVNFIISLHYLGDVIKDYFAEGGEFGVSIKYIHEKQPLGTAGALSLLSDIPSKPFIVINGDILTDINYSNLLEFHEANRSDATMAIKQYELQNPYGVVNTNGLEISSFEEKPIQISYVNGGIYALNPDTLSNLVANDVCDMPDFFMKLKSLNYHITAYPMHETWSEIGQPNDLSKANKDAAKK